MIKTQSHFHKRLNKDLQERVFFIDTPGIELSQTSLQQFLQHLKQIDQLIKLDEYSIRINLWILNFDSEVNELYQNMSKIENSKNTYYDLIDQNRQSISYFYIINQFDKSKMSESKPKLKALKEIQNQLYFENIFMISAQNALCYNLIKYGVLEAQNKCKKNLLNYRKQEFNSENDEQEYCENSYLIELQNFNKFTSCIVIKIHNQLNNLFSQRLQQLDLLIKNLEYSDWINQTLKQNQLFNQELSRLQVIFNISQRNYMNDLTWYNNFPYIEKNTQQAISKIKNKEDIQQNFKYALKAIKHINQYLTNMTINSISQLKAKLQLTLQVQPNQLHVYETECKEIIEVIIKNRMNKQSQQFLENQASQITHCHSITDNQQFEDQLRQWNLNLQLEFNRQISLYNQKNFRSHEEKHHMKYLEICINFNFNNKLQDSIQPIQINYYLQFIKHQYENSIFSVGFVIFDLTFLLTNPYLFYSHRNGFYYYKKQ